MKRRSFLAGAVTAPLAATGLSYSNSVPGKEAYLYHGCVPGYKPFRVIDSGLTKKKIKTFTKGSISVVKLTFDDGSAGWGQISTYDVDISAMVTVFTLHMMGAIPNAGPFFEYSIETGGVAKEAQALYRPVLKAKDGAVQIPAGPGWDVEINQEWLANTDYLKNGV